MYICVGVFACLKHKQTYASTRAPERWAGSLSLLPRCTVSLRKPRAHNASCTACPGVSGHCFSEHTAGHGACATQHITQHTLRKLGALLRMHIARAHTFESRASTSSSNRVVPTVAKTHPALPPGWPHLDMSARSSNISRNFQTKSTKS